MRKWVDIYVSLFAESDNTKLNRDSYDVSNSRDEIETKHELKGDQHNTGRHTNNIHVVEINVEPIPKTNFTNQAEGTNNLIEMEKRKLESDRSLDHFVETKITDQIIDSHYSLSEIEERHLEYDIKLENVNGLNKSEEKDSDKTRKKKKRKKKRRKREKEINDLFDVENADLGETITDDSQLNSSDNTLKRLDTDLL